ncbi:Xaa-Pro aminopeptidase [Malassezia cuniculi]|uniref:Xaa-Pro aminopeptidase n=1 Tax=Malassezia cuniculi TaxID=948313 RepID=A0AAF0ETD2_9BASI|nr:Xaa-Pro aminopeptidase [Malassezia cuniculi]
MGAPNTGMIATAARVQQLREQMRMANVDAYVVPSEDEHASEYPSDADLRRGYITGFNGSAGCAIVTSDAALLFTDGRYFLQASQQLEPGVWTLMRCGLPGVPSWQEWLRTLPKGARVGIDATTVTATDANDLDRSIKGEVVALDKNLVDAIWTDRPARPQEPIFVLPDAITGRSFADKIASLRKEAAEQGADGLVATTLDEVAWLFNLRGNDVPYNPVFFAFAVVLKDKTMLYVNDSQLSPEVRTHLGSEVEIRPYASFYGDLEQLGAQEGNEVRTCADKLLIGKSASLAVRRALGQRARIYRSLIIDQKSIKNDTELAGFREAHIRDGAALVRYFAWLEETLLSGKSVTETEGANMLEEMRSKQADFRGLSFTTISSTGPNGAIIHYAPPEHNSPKIDPENLYLCDSGGHYICGTTDVTRTLHFGTPTAQQKRCFTRVLQGHIAIDRVIFPHNTTGYMFDALARAPAWRDHLEYRHGTGHGVGHYLNVHEPPMGIGIRPVFNETGLKAGMVLSNEPGYYLDGEWGIRIENLMIVRPHTIDNEPKDASPFLCLERITLCPIQTKLVEVDLLTPAERTWLNAYHDEVRDKIRPVLESQGDARAVAWLDKECAHI